MITTRSSAEKRFRMLTLAMNSIIAACLLVFSFACTRAEQIEMNIKELRQAKEKLLKDPKDKDALSLLLNQLQDRRGIYRANAAAVLGELGDVLSASVGAEAVPALSRLLERDDATDQSAAARALARYGPHVKPALPILQKRLFPSDRDVAWFSARAIGNVGSEAAEAVPDLLKAFKEQRNTCEGYFSSCCEFFIPAFGKIGASAKAAGPELAELLNDNDVYLRMCAAVALMRIDNSSSEALKEIERLLKNPDVEVRNRTLTGLTDIGRDAAPAKSFVEAAATDADEGIRRQAKLLLSKLE
jgi:HEAT repeat protein